MVTLVVTQWACKPEGTHACHTSKVQKKCEQVWTPAPPTPGM